MKFLKTSLIVIIIISVVLLFTNYYSYIFAKSVDGEIVGVERVTEPAAVIGGGSLTPQQMYSFAVAIRDKETGTIFTASSEDRQWAVAKKGFCANAKFYPYPPWNLEKSGTYFRARLIELRDCNNLLGSGGVEATQQPAETPVPTPAPPESAPTATP